MKRDNITLQKWCTLPTESGKEEKRRSLPARSGKEKNLKKGGAPSFQSKGEIMYKELKLVRVNEKYIKFLSAIDNKVPYNSKNKKGRPFIGILFQVDKIQYFAPLSSPKAKHKKMPNNIDFLKISNGKYGVINFNNMVPVPEKEIIEIDYTAIKDKEYLSLLENQIRWSLLNSSKIKKHAEKLRERIQTLGEHSSDDEIEVAGLAGVLQKESDKTTQRGDDSNKESLQDTIGSITIQPRMSKTKPKGLFYGSEGNGKSKNSDTEGTIGADGGDPTTRNLGGTRHRSKKDTHKGRAIAGGHDTVHKRYGGDINQELKNVRVIKTSRNTYRVSFILPRDIRAGHVEIVTVGENGKSNQLAINSASELMGCTGIKKSSEGVSFSSMKGHEKVQFEIALLDNRDYAMEVNVYEHN